MTKILITLRGELKELKENSSEDLRKLETLGMKLRSDLISFGNLKDLLNSEQLKSVKYSIEKLKDDLEKISNDSPGEREQKE
jgi:hypothetical protein